MNEAEARARVEALMAQSDLQGQSIERLEKVYLEVPLGDGREPSPVRDVLAWRVDLWGGDRGARLAIDDRMGDVVKMERL